MVRGIVPPLRPGLPDGRGHVRTVEKTCCIPTIGGWRKKRIEAAIANRTALVSEYRITLPSGEVRWINALGKTAYGDDGHPRRMSGICLDITEQKRAEEALQTTLQRLQTLLASMRSAVLLVGKDDRIAFANQAFCDYFELPESPADLAGLTAEAAIGRIKGAYLHPDEEVARIGEIVRQEQSIAGEEVAMRSGRTYLRDFAPVVIDGKNYGRLWQHTDITERKRSEEAIRRSQKTFEELIERAPVRHLHRGFPVPHCADELRLAGGRLPQCAAPDRARFLRGHAHPLARRRGHGDHRAIPPHPRKRRTLLLAALSPTRATTRPSWNPTSGNCIA